MFRSVVFFSLFLFVSLAPGCGQDPPTPPSGMPPGPGEVNPADKPVDPRTERSAKLRKLLDTLDLRADLYGVRDIGKRISVPSADQPASGSCWPMAQNGIDWRWNKPDVLSPAEKYAALLLDAQGGAQLTSWVQKNQGKDAIKKPDRGICQGFVSSAILDPTPRSPILVKRVVKGTRVTVERCSIHDKHKKGVACVAFDRSDIAALLAELYSNADAIALGTACASQEVNFIPNANGVIEQPSMCKNSAATLFVLLTNLIGRGQLAFAIINQDAENPPPAWTQALFGYQIAKFDVVDAKTAAQLVGGATQTNPQAQGFRHVVLNVALSAVAMPMVDPEQRAVQINSYELVLELDDKKAILGGAWVGKSQGDHPAGYFMPLAPGTKAPLVTVDGVKALLNLSLSGGPFEGPTMGMTGSN